MCVYQFRHQSRVWGRFPTVIKLIKLLNYENTHFAMLLALL